MSYLHSVIGVMVADDVMRRRKKVLSKLQQELYDVIVKFVENDPDTYESVVARYGSFEAYCDSVERSVKTMNAVELRKELKVWRETDVL